MKGILEIIPVEIHNKVDGNETVKGLRYCIQFEAEKEDILSKASLNEIRDTAKAEGLGEGYYEFDLDDKGIGVTFTKTTKPEF